MKRTTILVALVIATFALPAWASERFWWGGGLGVGFGDVTYIAAEPSFGYRATEALSVGLGLSYRYRDDGRFDPDITTEDYGANLFTRYRVTPRMFVQAEYEYLDYEFVRFDGSTDRDDYNSLLGGVGYSQPLSGRASLFTTALYNFSYDEDEPAPYDDPWIFRVGVNVGF